METKKPKKQGTNRTPPQLMKLPTGNFSAWQQSLEAQLKHLNTIREEAAKAATSHNYRPKIKVTKRFESFYQEEIVLARARAKRKKKRS